LADTEFEKCIDKCNMFLWEDTRSTKQLAAKLLEKNVPTSVGIDREIVHNTG
jgi:16S rRNA C1402 (ribose-2'-O) methylase RsmI